MVTRFGLTWWGKRWIGALEALGAVYANRLPRGRTYARQGRVTNLTVAAGRVTARVQGRRARPYRVTLTLPVFDDATWDSVLGALAGEVRHTAALLDGRMPDDVDDVLQTCGVSLFPRARELSTSCSCPDAANPCKHVAAVHYTLAQTFDDDPFLLPRLRGRDRDQLLAGLRAQRAGADEPTADAAADDAQIAVSDLIARDLFTARGPLDEIDLRPRPASDPTATLRRLGPPPAATAVEADLHDLATDAAALAWQILAGPGDSQ
ncbi:MAG: SWIM zinc finger family protein [Actinobacteria bacterium]|nr:SWIM zinc finger family protein [Actinomycetota bacterium]